MAVKYVFVTGGVDLLTKASAKIPMSQQEKFTDLFSRRNAAAISAEELFR